MNFKKFQGKKWENVKHEVGRIWPSQIVVLRDGDSITMEFNAGRLKVWLNPDETVRSMSVG